MDLIANEMLQDPAILMTSKNPSLSQRNQMTSKGARPRTSSYNTNGGSHGNRPRKMSGPRRGDAIPFYPLIFNKPGVSNEYVSREITEYYQRNRQNNDQFKTKQTLRHALENTLKQSFPDYAINLYMVGSSTNGIGDNPSSVDICIMADKVSKKVVKEAPKAVDEVAPKEIAEEEAPAVEQPQPAIEPAPLPDLTLAMIESVLQGKNFAKNIVSIPAKVPIIKFRDDIAKMDITLNLNQDVSIRNTQLVRDYAKVDWRFPQLAMMLKTWARENRIASAIDKTISSYSWTLMTIHYLQVCDPPVLPTLQKLVPRRYDSRNNVRQTITNWRRYPTKWTSNNTCNLRQLLKGLFRYYGYVFHYDQHVISVREGRVLERAAMPGAYNASAASSNPPPTTGGQWSSFLCIEEPFTRSNTTRSVHDKEQFQRILELLRMSSNALRGVRISLFNVIADDIDFPIKYYSK